MQPISKQRLGKRCYATAQFTRLVNNRGFVFCVVIAEVLS
jgi:hypothetical protein